MKSLVVDGPTALSFLIKDEFSAPALEALRAIEGASVVYVPSHWWLETTNGLLMAERRKRASQLDTAEALQLINSLPITTDSETAFHCGGEIINLARRHTLTIYDAAYLELAMRRHATLATFDRALARAADAAGLEVLA